MSAISGISGYNLNLLSLLSQADSGSADSSLANAAESTALEPAASQTADTATAGTGPVSSAQEIGSDLQTQIQTAVSAALQSAEQSGNPDLKSVVYTTLVQTLQNNGIDPTTLQPTGAPGSSPVDPTTGAVLSQVLTALSAAAAASDPLIQLASSQTSAATSGLTSLPSPSQIDLGSSDPLLQSLASEGDSQGAVDLSSLLSSSGNTAQDTGNLFSTFPSSQNSNQNLLGFLYDSGQ